MRRFGETEDWFTFENLIPRTVKIIILKLSFPIIPNLIMPCCGPGTRECMKMVFSNAFCETTVLMNFYENTQGKYEL
jgi:hypothetical protein